MFLKLIKDYFIKKEVKINPVKNTTFSRTVGVLLDVNEIDDLDFLKNKFLNELFKDYTVVFLTYNEEKATAKTLDKQEISSKSFSLFGKIQDNLINHFKENNFFILIGLANNNLYLNKIIQEIPASYKFGFNQSNNHIFNVSLNGLLLKNSEFYPELERNLKSFNIIK